MGTMLGWVKRVVPTKGQSVRPYECARCATRFERQPHACPECGAYQIDWRGWQDEDWE